MWLHIAVIGLVIFSQACQTFSSAPIKSSWSALQQASSTDCEPWTKRPGDMEVMVTHPVSIQKRSGFVVQAKNRSGAGTYYYADFKDDNIDAENFTPFNWGQRSRYLGMVNLNGLPSVIIQQVTKSGRRIIEARDPLTNVVKFTSNSRWPKFHAVSVHSSPNGFWVVYKNHDINKSIDDEPTRVLEAQMRSGEKLELINQKGFEVYGPLQAFAMDDKKLAIYWLEQIQKKLHQFKYTILDSDPARSSLYDVAIKPIERVESWVVSRHRDGIALVYVSGDTLIWENAKLEYQIFDGSGDALWSRSFAIENEHVGDPIIATTPTFSYVMIPKWLDSESTLDVQKITATEVESLGYHGIFKEGTHINQGYLSAENKLFAIKRFPSGFIKQQAVCEIDL